MVIGPDITSSSLVKSAKAARGRPQFATWCDRSVDSSQTSGVRSVLVPRNVCLGRGSQKAESKERLRDALKKYSRAAGDLSQLANLEAMVGETLRGIDGLTSSKSRKVGQQASVTLPYMGSHVG